jgi:pyruvate,water dikinase
LQPGEILITRYTDIAWSPFFPIIAGLVTEIGGLLSHGMAILVEFESCISGSVVAREYGLPSLIAVDNATTVFKTGDVVVLDSKLGLIRKVTDN